MAWQGTFRKLRPGDIWSQEPNIEGLLVHDMGGQGMHEVMVARELVEDDGKPFEEGERIEILIRRITE